MKNPEPLTERERNALEKRRQQAAWLSSLISNCQETRFYGKLVVDISDGIILTVKQEQSLRPPNDSKKDLQGGSI